jgi:hypothetical protein
MGSMEVLSLVVVWVVVKYVGRSGVLLKMGSRRCCVKSWFHVLDSLVESYKLIQLNWKR